MTQIRQLGQVMEVLEGAGYPVTHAFDDLIFIEHNPFLLQFSEDDAKKIYFYGHVDWEQNKHEDLFEIISILLSEQEHSLVDKGRFDLAPNEDQKEAIDIMRYDHDSLK